MFYTGLYREKHEEILLSETIGLRALVFGMWHDLLDLYKFVQIMLRGPKMATPQGHMFYMVLYREKHENILSETTRPGALIFGM